MNTFLLVCNNASHVVNVLTVAKSSQDLIQDIFIILWKYSNTRRNAIAALINFSTPCAAFNRVDTVLVRKIISVAFWDAHFITFSDRKNKLFTFKEEIFELAGNTRNIVPWKPIIFNDKLNH